MWNPESTGMEPGVHSMESGIQDSRELPKGDLGVHLILGVHLFYTSCSFLNGQLQCPFVRLSKSDSNQQQFFSRIETRTIRSHQNQNQAKISSA